MNTSLSLVGVTASRRTDSVRLVRPPALAIIGAASARLSALAASALRLAGTAGPLLIAGAAAAP